LTEIPPSQWPYSVKSCFVCCISHDFFTLQKGQPDFNSNGGGAGANGLSLPVGVYADAIGVYIADVNNNRVLFFPGNSTTASIVYGQCDCFFVFLIFLVFKTFLGKVQ
jgi:hypothetical protein